MYDYCRFFVILLKFKTFNIQKLYNLFNIHISKNLCIIQMYDYCRFFVYLLNSGHLLNKNYTIYFDIILHILKFILFI